MVDPYAARLWGYRALFAGVIGVLAVARLMPVDAGHIGWPGPDLMLALTLAWVLRRPEYVPAWLIVALFLPLDLLFQRPPGLGALTVLLGTEFLRRRHEFGRGLPFPLEWGLVAAVLLAMAGAGQAILAVFVVPRPPLGLELMRALFTSAIYPLAVAVSVFVLGVRRAAPGDVDGAAARA